MMVGVLTTLAIVAFLTVLTRDWLIDYTARHGASILRLTRALDAASNAIGLRRLGASRAQPSTATRRSATSPPWGPSCSWASSA
jgi:hypothetical protein